MDAFIWWDKGRWDNAMYSASETRVVNLTIPETVKLGLGA